VEDVIGRMKERAKWKFEQRREEGGGKREEGRGRRKEGRGKREEGGGKFNLQSNVDI
jgi:hypothetical protein